MRSTFAIGMLLICSGVALQAQDLHSSTSTLASSTAVVLAGASINSPGSATGMGTDAFARATTAGTSSPVLAMIPQSLKSVPRLEPSQREIKMWRGLLVAEHSAAIFDAATTRDSLASGNGYERNPLVRPFANSPAIYPALQIAPVAFDFLSHAMMRSRNPLLRKTWWLPQATSMAASLWCGSRNIHVANLHQ
jgi:hypothetical protein